MVPIMSRPIVRPDFSSSRAGRSGDFSFISHSDEAMDIATSMTAPTAPTIIIAKIIALRSIGFSGFRL